MSMDQKMENVKFSIDSFEEIDESLNILDLTIRLQIGYREGFIKYDCFDSRMEVNYDSNSTLNKFSRPAILKKRFRNLVLTTIGMVSCALNSALDKKFGAKDPTDRSDLGTLRAIIYMIRCAFAHDPCHPKWLCRKKYTNFPYEISINKSNSDRIEFVESKEQVLVFEMDFEELNGKSLNLKDFNALDGFFLLAEYAPKCVREKESS